MISTEVNSEKEYLFQLRRWFHQHPEKSLCEFETAKKIEQELDAIGIEHVRVGETGIYAHIDGAKGPGAIIALRADIDGLEMQDLKNVAYKSLHDGFAHACGHDAHAAVLLTAAKILNQKKDSFAGQIRLFFQQAEEIGQGARQFVKSGLMQDVTRVFGAHVSSSIDSGYISLTPGPMNASCDYFKLEITGKGAHVSTPQLGIDALYIASQIIVNLQSIVARSSDPIDTVVVGCGVLQAGTQYNIIAEHAVIEGTTRTFNAQSREYTNRRVEEIAKGIASMHGAQAKVTFQAFASPLINNATVAQEAAEIAERIIGKEHIIQNQEKMLGADDFADFLEQAPGVYAFVGTRNANDANTGAAHHHGLFDIDEDAMLASCNLFVDYTINELKKGERK